MQIRYCSRCNKQIPPGGPDEGRHFISGGKLLCPACYRKIPAEEHSGSTLVRGDAVTKPPTTKVAFRAPSSRVLTPAKRQPGVRPTSERASARRWPGAPLTIALIALAALLAIGAVVGLKAGCGSPRKPGEIGDAGQPLCTLKLDGAGKGRGRVEVSPPGGRYPAGTGLVLTALPEPGSRFARWEDGASGTENPKRLVLFGGLRVVAVFEPEGAGPPTAPSSEAGDGARVPLLDLKPARLINGGNDAVRLGVRVEDGGRTYEPCIAMERKSRKTPVVGFNLEGRYSTFECEFLQLGTGGAGVLEAVIAADGRVPFKSRELSGSCRLDVSGVQQLDLKCYAAAASSSTDGARLVWINPRLTRSGPSDSKPEPAPSQAKPIPAGAGISLLGLNPVQTVGSGKLLRFGERVEDGGRVRENCIVMAPPQYRTVVVAYHLGGRYSTFEAGLVQTGTDGDRRYEFIVYGDGKLLLKSYELDGSCRVDVAGVERLELKGYISLPPPEGSKCAWVDPRLLAVDEGAPQPAPAE